MTRLEDLRHPMNRFHGDLWNADRATIVAAAVGIMTERSSYPVRKVWPLTSGLSVRITLANDAVTALFADDIRRYVWRVTACTHPTPDTLTDRERIAR